MICQWNQEDAIVYGGERGILRVSETRVLLIRLAQENSSPADLKIIESGIESAAIVLNLIRRGKIPSNRQEVSLCRTVDKLIPPGHPAPGIHACTKAQQNRDVENSP
jgi:hypothetical protein